MEQIIVSLKFMNFIFPSFLILIVSSALCYSGTISFNNATFIIPDNWRTTYVSNDVVTVDDSSNMLSVQFAVGSGYPIGNAFQPDDPIPDISIFQDGSFQSENDFADVITQIDSDMFQNISNYNAWMLEYSEPDMHAEGFLFPTKAFINSQGSIERTYSVYFINYGPPWVGSISVYGNIGIIVDANSIIYYQENVYTYNLDISSSSLESTPLFNISDSYLTTNPLITIAKPTDSDMDGIPDEIETYLGNDPNDDSDAQASMDGIQNKYSLEEIKDLRAGSKMIEISNGEATISMEVEESDELGSWTISGNLSTNILLKAGEDKKFFRFKMNDSDFDLNDLTLSVGDIEYDETAIKAALAEQYDVPVESISLSVNPG